MGEGYYSPNSLLPQPMCAGCIGVVTCHANCVENMRVSLVKCRSCRTGCSCTAETGICTVPGGAVRKTWGTAPVNNFKKKIVLLQTQKCVVIQKCFIYKYLCPGPVCVKLAWWGCPGRRRWALPVPHQPVLAWRHTLLCEGWDTSCDPTQMLALTR